MLPALHALRDDPGVPKQRLVEAMQRVASLYTDWGKPGQADAYRDLLRSVAEASKPE